MTVHVSFMGPVRKPASFAGGSLDVAEGATVAALLVQLGYAPHEVRHLAVLVNAVRAPGDKALNNGDRVELALPIGGGCDCQG